MPNPTTGRAPARSSRHCDERQPHYRAATAFGASAREDARRPQDRQLGAVPSRTGVHAEHRLPKGGIAHLDDLHRLPPMRRPFAMIAGSRFGNYKAGFRFGRLGYELVEPRGLTRYQARIYMSFGNIVMPWARHPNVERLFQALYTTRPDPLGVGLTIGLSIILSHGGHLWRRRTLVTGQHSSSSCPRGEVRGHERR